MLKPEKEIQNDLVTVYEALEVFAQLNEGTAWSGWMEYWHHTFCVFKIHEKLYILHSDKFVYQFPNLEEVAEQIERTINA